MEVDAVGPSHGGAVRFSTAEQAQQLALERKTAHLQGQGMAMSQAPNVTTSVTFSPSLYAQAAQYQLYTQSGTLASLLTQGSVATPVQTPFHEHPDEIHAVEESQGSSVDTLA